MRCESITCKKPLPDVSQLGNPISNHRKKKRKYCNNSCARTESARRAREKRIIDREAIHAFLYKPQRVA